MEIGDIHGQGCTRGLLGLIGRALSQMVAVGGLEPLSKPKIHTKLRLCVLIS